MIQVDRVERGGHLPRVEVTGALGQHRLDQPVGVARQAVGVVLGLDVSRHDGNRELLTQVGEGPLEQRGLSRARG